ncbi:MAG: restriction endonuclease subunit S [Rhizomicrobium sp.]
MRTGWNLLTFGEIGRVFNGNSISESEKKANFAGLDHGVPYIGTKDVGFDHEVEYESGVRIPGGKQNGFKLAPANTVLVCAEGGSAGRKIALTNREVYFGNKLFAICPTPPNNSRFVFYYCLSDDFGKQFRGAMAGLIGGVSLNKFKDFSIPLPPPAEQQRIVEILDKALVGIATAKTNTEKSLQRAHALFENTLNIAIQGKLIAQNSRDTSVEDLVSQIEKTRNVAIIQGRAKSEKTEPAEIDAESQIELPSSWKWAQLESLTVAISDGVHKKPRYASKGIPFVTVKNLTAGPGISFDDLNYITREDHQEFIKRTHPERGDILITKDGTIGVVRLIETDVEFSIFVSVALIKPVMQELGPYLAYALRAQCVQSQIVPQGAALKHLYLVDLRRLAIPLPPLSEQKRIVARLDGVNVETQRLQSIYRQKLAALDSLKKSLLHQAFSGELTKDTVKSNVVPFPKTMPNITHIDMHAGILAIAYQHHEDHSRQDTFGHVKAEKIAHMVETHVGIDCGRTPVKDAAGPNDYRHLKKVEHRAEKAGYFSFKQSAARSYTFRKLNRFDQLTQKARNALGSANHAVDELIELMVPMQTQQAEIFATVFAAWNNLLLDGQEVSDEAIVSEARENWHSDKLGIPRDKFFKAIVWMKEKNIVPVGRGKKVINRVGA